ncbi:PBP1b-binding outer membrane lipoprotein LpoB [Sphingomonas insulae]|uniref:Lipoprotein n=1 Tax=Sphingomonas insulae TaxID=424800 RepID=A0ABN1HMN7_9SPHN|nr:hypothetical protein [Sphingomonas insulae]NIJ31640.1 PBP1b-binding outer membrane lipoprotein LpoB [Sphingomonas insulae]
MRIMGASLALSFMLAGCGGSEEEPDASTTKTAQSPVVAESIDFADKDCAAQGLPIALVLKNNGSEATRSVSWHFAVNRVNHSDNLTGLDMATPFTDANRRTDRIIAPGESFKVCSSAPSIEGYAPDSKELEYRVILDTK